MTDFLVRHKMSTVHRPTVKAAEHSEKDVFIRSGIHCNVSYLPSVVAHIDQQENINLVL
jgi:hypothetical protein